MPPKYKPGGKRFPPRVTSKPLPKQIVNNVGTTLSGSPSGASVVLDEDAENQFELELCWCIQQLQISIDSGKLGEKQMLDTTKSLGLLKSNTVAMIRKRQVMRNTFGDYRAKMLQDEKKHGKYVNHVKFSTPKTNAGKSVFLKKAACPEDGEALSENPSDDSKATEESTGKKVSVMSKQPSDVPFTFNFSEPQSK